VQAVPSAARIVTVLALGLSLASSSASAATITGTPRAERLAGTAGADSIDGAGGADRLEGRGGGDFLAGGGGRDSLLGGPGNDRLATHYDGSRDTVTCGSGRDVVNADASDRLSGDCEVVSRRLSRDPYLNGDQHETQVEPDSFAFGSTVVSTFQVGRFFDGGAANTGFATSRDAGRTWRAGYLPGLTSFSTPPGPVTRASDPVVAYDAAHDVWLIASLGISPVRDYLLVSRSRDGVRWELPAVAARSQVAELAYDKEWVTCDNWPSSPFYGRCYLSYTDVRGNRLATQRSTDGGLTWSPPASPAVGSGPRQLSVLGAQPAARPDGSFVVVFHAFTTEDSGSLVVTRSGDGGITFATPTRVAGIDSHRVRGMRAPPLPSVDVDSLGRVYAAWHDCGLRPSCNGNDVVLSTSADGLVWSPPRRISGRGPRADSFIPGLAVEPGSAAARPRLAAVYYLYPRADCRPCRLDVMLVRSADGGASWSAPQRLNAESMPLSWIASTTSGRMVGDYISTSWAAGRPVSVFSLAASPRSGRFRQATFANTLR